VSRGAGEPGAGELPRAAGGRPRRSLLTSGGARGMMGTTAGLTWAAWLTVQPLSSECLL